MPDPEDAVVPILRSIQRDIAEQGLRLTRVEAKVDALGGPFDAFESYFTYEMGRTSRHDYDIKVLQEEVRAIKGRLEEMEPQA